MSDTTPKPWTIRNVTENARQAAIEAADRAALDLGPWVSQALCRQAQLERGGTVGEVVSVTPSDSLAVVAMLFAGLGQVADKKGCGGVAARARALLDQHMAAMALAPLPARQTPPRIDRPMVQADAA